MIRHHPEDELIVDFATGALGEGPALVVATHAAMCGSCRARVALVEAVGGLMLEDLEGEPVSAGLLDETLAMLDEGEDAATVAAPVAATDDREQVPEPLLRYIGRGLSHLVWRRVPGFPAIEEARLPIAAGVKAVLMRLKSGAVVPEHSHRGNEYSVVLAGGFCDGATSYGRGDFLARDPSHTHRPAADNDGDCLCLIVLDAPLRLTGALGMIVNPFLRI
ncbi:MAG: cupin domain-containing protein [Rhodospirillales bacterium]|nr:cupin domain-containing protein [Rhodospirillales bacterium]